MTLPIWKTDCGHGCSQEVGMNQKRDRFCEHGRPYVKEREDGGVKSVWGSSLERGKSFAASDAQRAKVAGMPCAGCGRQADGFSLVVDPAHLWRRGKGGCDSPDCVRPLCRSANGRFGCHVLFDEGNLDLLPRLADSEAWQVEQAHPILVHGVSPVELVRRLSGGSYEFVRVPHTPNSKGPQAAPEGAVR